LTVYGEGFRVHGVGFEGLRCMAQGFEVWVEDGVTGGWEDADPASSFLFLLFITLKPRVE
jgi:hypothetical protein